MQSADVGASNENSYLLTLTVWQWHETHLSKCLCSTLNKMGSHITPDQSANKRKSFKSTACKSALKIQ